MSLRAREFPDRGVLVWFALTAGIAAWTAHLIGFASLVAFVHDNGYFWIFYVGNGVAIVITLLAAWLSYLMIRSTDDDESAGTTAGRIRFLGIMALLTNGINLMLILLEGTYVFFLRTGG
ncbi:MAG TPA: hypothetical protein VH986_03260 [Acidimicrobiia bacterium]|jgi:hypothetical protein